MTSHIRLVLANPAKWERAEAAIILKKVPRPDYDPQTGSKGCVMRICPTCADQVAVTLRYCPRCSTLLPEPGYRPALGYYAESGHYPDSRHYAESGQYAEPEYDPEPGYRPAPGHPAEPGYPAAPAYPAEPGYSGAYLPAPYVEALDQPGQYATSSYQTDQYEAIQHQADQYQADQYEPDQYQATAYPTSQYEASPYQPGPGEPVRGGPDRYGEAPGEDDPDGCDPFGDRFAGGGPGTAASPARPAPAAVTDGEWDDTASRLLYSPPSPPRRAGRAAAGHRAQVISATLAAAALLAGLVTARAAFGGHQGAGPGTRLAGRQTATTRGARPPASGSAAPSPSSTAAPSPSSTAAPSPSVPAPAGAPAMVTIAPGLSQTPDAAQVDGFLASYFTAINTRDYQQYEQLLIPARRAQLSVAAFSQGYGTTTDTSASLVGIAPTTGGVAATVTFTSEQRAAPGADVTGCTYWDITLYLRRQDGALLMGNPPAGYHAYHRSCG
jgi:hypothetical protein